jgi:hypothetical protein
MAATRLPTSGHQRWLRSIRYSTSASRLLKLTCTWTKPNQLKSASGSSKPPPPSCSCSSSLSQIRQIKSCKRMAATRLPTSSANGGSDPIGIPLPPPGCSSSRVPNQTNFKKFKRLAANRWAPIVAMFRPS